MEALEAAVESLSFPSCGPQADGTKRSQPQWSLPKAGRDDVKKVFISKKHPQDLLGRDSPGFVYSPKRQRELPKWGFGTSAARPPVAGAKYPESSNDLVGNIPDSQLFKYGQRTASIGTCPRDVISNAPDLAGFPKGAISPGPQRYNPQRAPPAVRLAHAPKVDEIPPSYTMRPKTKIIEQESQTGPRVGPGIYPVPDACGQQAASTKKSLPQWSLHKVDRFQNVRHHDSGRLWDGTGDRKLQYNRTFSASPSFSFGTSTRGQAQRVAPALTALDKGPVSQMPHRSQSHPQLAPRREVIKYTDVLSG